MYNFTRNKRVAAFFPNCNCLEKLLVEEALPMTAEGFPQMSGIASVPKFCVCVIHEPPETKPALNESERTTGV